MCRILLAMYPPPVASGKAACEVAIVAGNDGSSDDDEHALPASRTIEVDVHAAGATRSRDRTCPTKESL